MICPNCGAEMRRDAYRNLWICTAYEPYFEMDVDDTRPVEAILGSSPVQLLRAPTAIPLLPPPAFQDVDAMLAAWETPAFVATTTAATTTTSEFTNYTLAQYEVIEEKRVTEREITRAWFDGMPKSIKLLLIALNPEEEGNIGEHYSHWDNRKIQYNDFTRETREHFHKARKRLACPAPE
jgi:hypothetical protein